MSVVNVKENWSGDDGQVEENASRRTKVYTVLTDSAADDVAVVLAADGLPVWNAPWPGDGQFGVRGRVGRRVSTKLWEVTISYVRQTWGGLGSSGGDPAADPLDQPPQISWRSNASNEAIDEDVEGNAIINSAGEPFESPVTEEFHDSVLVIRENIAAYDESVHRLYRGALNANEYRGAPPGVAKIASIQGERVFSGELTYWQRTTEVHFRETGWDHRLLDQGFREDAGTDSDNKPVYRQIVDQKGQPLSSPVLLDGSGNKLAAGADPHWLTFVTKRRRSFSVIGL